MSSTSVPVSISDFNGEDYTTFFNLGINGEKLDLWELGKYKHHGKLDNLLQPLDQGKFVVDNPAKEAFLTTVRMEFDRSRSSSGMIITHEILYRDDGDKSLQRLLSLGVNADLPNDEGWRPSHLCGQNGMVQAVTTIFNCRPNMEAKNNNSDTPLEAAAEANYEWENAKDTLAERKRTKRRLTVHSTWESLLKRGFPSLAELASQKAWYAVKYLVRRRVITEDEAFGKHKGRDAMEWADFYGETGMVGELKYYFGTWLLEKRLKDLAASQESFSKRCGSLEAENVKLQKENAQLERQHSKLEKESFAKRCDSLEAENGKLQKEKAQLEQQNSKLKKEIEEMKEGVLLSVNKSNETASQLESLAKEFRKTSDDSNKKTEALGKSVSTSKKELQKEVEKASREFRSHFDDEMKKQKTETEKELRQTNEKLKNQNEELKQQLASQEVQVRKLNEDMGLMKEIMNSMQEKNVGTGMVHSEEVSQSNHPEIPPSTAAEEDEIPPEVDLDVKPFLGRRSASSVVKGEGDPNPFGTASSSSTQAKRAASGNDEVQESNPSTNKRLRLSNAQCSSAAGIPNGNSSGTVTSPMTEREGSSTSQVHDSGRPGGFSSSEGMMRLFDTFLAATGDWEEANKTLSYVVSKRGSSQEQ